MLIDILKNDPNFIGRCLCINHCLLNWIVFSVNLRQLKCQYYGQDVIAIQRQLCDIPQTLQGEWFSREHGENVFTTISSDSLSNRGQCLQMISTNYDNFTLVLKQGQNRFESVFCLSLGQIN